MKKRKQHRHLGALLWWYELNQGSVCLFPLQKSCNAAELRYPVPEEQLPQLGR